jgi:phosphoribosylformimino-5-aminoimidazole carboxamide ribotide isomerase
MLIIPALYIQKGRLVSLYKGQESSQKKVYAKTPFNMAKIFQKQGASIIHLIDLDGSEAGEMKNLKMVTQMAKTLHVPIEYGGGIRKIDEIIQLFEAGVSRIILGVSARALIPEALSLYGPEKIIFGIKARRHMVESDSLAEDSDEVIEMAKLVVDKGITQIVYKDLQRIGTLYHPNYDDVDNLIVALGDRARIYSSGGVAAMDDFRILETIGVSGVIVSRAFIEHKISLSKGIQDYETDQDRLGLSV